MAGHIDDVLARAKGKYNLNEVRGPSKQSSPQHLQNETPGSADKGGGALLPSNAPGLLVEWLVMQQYPDEPPEPFGSWIGKHDVKSGDRIMLKWLEGDDAGEVEVLQALPGQQKLWVATPKDIEIMKSRMKDIVATQRQSSEAQPVHRTDAALAQGSPESASGAAPSASELPAGPASSVLTHASGLRAVVGCKPNRGCEGNRYFIESGDGANGCGIGVHDDLDSLQKAWIEWADAESGAAKMADLVLPPDDDARLVGMAMVKRFIKLDDIKKRVDDIGKEAGARIDSMKMRIAEWFAEQGMETVRVDGYTVYIRRQLWASYKTPDRELSADERRGWKQAFIDELKKAEWEIPDPDQPGAKKIMTTRHLVHDDYNAQTLSALIRELPVDDKGDPILPPELKESIKITYNVMPCKRKTR